MRHTVSMFVIAAAGLAVQSGAQAQAVWRCGNSYSQQPCAGGAKVPAADPRTPAETARAGDVARGDWALADRLERERLAREKNAGKALVIGPAQPAASAASAARKDKKARELAAIDPATVKHRKKKRAKKDS